MLEGLAGYLGDLRIGSCGGLAKMLDCSGSVSLCGEDSRQIQMRPCKIRFQSQCFCILARRIRQIPFSGE